MNLLRVYKIGFTSSTLRYLSPPRAVHINIEINMWINIVEVNINYTVNPIKNLRITG